MATARQHRAAAARHLRAYRATVARFPDWAAVMLFYASIHMLEEAFAYEGKHSTTHQDRELHIKVRHPTVWSAHHRLQSESMKARYLHGGAFGMAAKPVDRELRRQKLAQIRRYIRGLLAAASRRAHTSR